MTKKYIFNPVSPRLTYHDVRGIEHCLGPEWTPEVRDANTYTLAEIKEMTSFNPIRRPRPCKVCILKTRKKRKS